MTDTITEEGTSRFVQTKKWRLHYHEVGEGHPVVLLHGSGPGASGWSNFRPNIGPLGQHFRALSIDMPGWGQSDTAKAEDRDHSEALLLFLDELGIEKAAVVGNSMGGMTAIQFAVEHPDRISHLIPMGAPFPGPTIFGAGGGPTEGLKVLFEAYREPTPANFKRLVSIMAFDPRFASDELAEERSRNALAHPEHLDNFVKGMATMGSAFFSLTPELHKIETPTLVVHGRDDRTISYDHALHTVALIANSRLLLLNRCGHWAQLEHADEFNRAVTDFIQNN
jgi:2-hydroxy-6-oxonona-2,4-dienedioate hydrolase